jgi:hypothetical protein
MMEKYADSAVEVAIELVRDRQARGEYLAASIWLSVAVKLNYRLASDPEAERRVLDELRVFLLDAAIMDRLRRGQDELGLSASHVLVELEVE